MRTAAPAWDPGDLPDFPHSGSARLRQDSMKASMPVPQGPFSGRSGMTIHIERTDSRRDRTVVHRRRRVFCSCRRVVNDGRRVVCSCQRVVNDRRRVFCSRRRVGHDGRRVVCSRQRGGHDGRRGFCSSRRVTALAVRRNRTSSGTGRHLPRFALSSFEPFAHFALTAFLCVSPRTLRTPRTGCSLCARDHCAHDAQQALPPHP